MLDPLSCYIISGVPKSSCPGHRIWNGHLKIWTCYRVALQFFNLLDAQLAFMCELYRFCYFHHLLDCKDIFPVGVYLNSLKSQKSDSYHVHKYYFVGL